MLLLQQQLLFRIVRRMAKLVADSLNLILFSHFFVYIQTRYNSLYVPRGGTAAFIDSIWV